MSTGGYSSAIRNDKYPPCASTWMELEGMMLSEISQSEKDKHYMVSFILGNINNSEREERKGKANCIPYGSQITQPLETTNTHHLLQRGWNWRVLC